MRNSRPRKESGKDNNQPSRFKKPGNRSKNNSEDDREVKKNDSFGEKKFGRSREYEGIKEFNRRRKDEGTEGKRNNFSERTDRDDKRFKRDDNFRGERKSDGYSSGKNRTEKSGNFGRSYTKTERKADSSGEYKKYPSSSRNSDYRKKDEFSDQKEGGSRTYRKRESRDGFEEKPKYSRRNEENEGSYPRKRAYPSDRSKSTGEFEKRPYRERGEGRKNNDDRGDKPFERNSRENRSSFEKRSYSERGEGRKNNDDRGDKPFERNSRDKRSSFEKRSYTERGEGRKNNDDRGDKPFERNSRDNRSSREEGRNNYSGREKNFSKEGDFRGDRKRDFTYSERPTRNSSDEPRTFSSDKDRRPRKKREDIELEKRVKEKESSGSKLIRLNKYLSNAGVCSRREADDLIVSGAVTVNGKTITELGYKVSPTDDVAYGGAPIKKEKKVYVLLNKPKDFITTMDDEKGRRTVMELVQNAGRERIFPVGRLDRNTTGLLLFTNDGDMALKLTHPKHQVQKMYHVVLNMKLRQEDLEAILQGVELEDGLIKPDKIEFTGEGNNKKEIGIEIHSGKNRIVRRLFEKFGYEIVKLDRVMFASLTKKDLPRGRWRFLTEREINFLKMIS